MEETDRLSLDHLPRDEFVHILKHLDPSDIAHLAQTCSEVHKLLQVGALLCRCSRELVYRSDLCHEIHISDRPIFVRFIDNT